MAITSQLGTADSRFGNIQLGLGSPSVIYTRSISDAVTFSETWEGHNLSQTITDTITFNAVTTAFAVRGQGVDTITFSESLTVNTVLLLSISDTLTFSETIINTKYGVAADTLVFDDDAEGFRNLLGPASDALTLSESLTRQYLASRVINEGLTFTETISRTLIRPRSVSDSLVITESMVGFNTKPTSDSLVFDDDLTVYVSKALRESLDFDSIFYLNAIFDKRTADVFEMYDSIFLNTYMRLPVTETVTFADVMHADRVTPIHESIVFTEATTWTSSKITTDIITFVDSVTVNKVKNIGLADQLTFSSVISVSLVVERTIAETLTFTEQCRGIRVKFGTSTDSFAFADQVVREVHAVVFDDSLSFSDDLDYLKTGSRTATDTLSFSDSLFVNTVTNLTLSDTLTFKEKPPADSQPSSSIGIPDGREGPYASVANRLMMFIGQTRSLVITPAEFNDYLSDRNQVVFKRRMNGSVTTFIKTCPDEKLHYEFIVSKPKADEFRAFLDAENGRAFTIYDWKGQVWIAKLLTDTIDKEEVGRWEPCGNKTRITVEFLGRRYA